MGRWKRDGVDRQHVYFPEIGEIVAYTGGGVGVADRRRDERYDLVNLDGATVSIGARDIQPATEDETLRMCESVDLTRVELDRPSRNTLRGLLFGDVERDLKAFFGRVMKRDR